MHRGQEEKECWLKGRYTGAGKEDWRLDMVIWRTGCDLQLLHMINLGDCCEKHWNTLAAIIRTIINMLSFSKPHSVQRLALDFLVAFVSDCSAAFLCFFHSEVDFKHPFCKS